MADPISRNPTFLPSIAAIQEAVIQEADNQGTSPTAAASSAETPSAFQGVGQSILSGYALDKEFGNTDFVRRHELVQEGGFWYKGDQLAVPAGKELRKECIALVHTPPYCGHLGGNRTFQAARQLFWWVGMKGDALAFVKDCGLCQRNKHPNHKPFGFLQPLRVPDFRWESVSMDFIVQLPMTKNGKDAILVFVDRLSKMVHFAATNTTVTAEDTAKLFRHEVFRLHGMPREIISDRDTRFTSAFWKEVCRLLSIRQGLSTAYHPQTDGQTERTNRILEDMLRHYVNPTLDDWDEHLDAVEFAVNNAWQESIRTTPFFLNYGLRPHTPSEVELPSRVPAAASFSQEWQLTVSEALRFLGGAEQRYAAEQRKHEADVATTEAQANMKLAQGRQKGQADKRRTEEPNLTEG